MSDHDDPEDPEDNLLNAISRLTGEEHFVTLRDSDSEGSAADCVEQEGWHSERVPKGQGYYQLLGEIARGSMGVVLRGHDAELGRDVAVKVLSRDLVDDPNVLQRFVEEAQIGGQLQHPGIVPVYELGMMGDARPYFAMKLIKGRTLATLLSSRTGLDDDRRRFLSIFESVCQAVAYAHSKGVIHRDLKPDNIMIGAFGEVQVVDWGLAKVLGSAEASGELAARSPDAGAIQTVRSGTDSSVRDSIFGTALGTPAYMPPEQALGNVAVMDERSDVFALGGILCEILTGTPPYLETEDEHPILLAARADLDPAYRRINECAADAELKTLVLDCLCESPDSRPDSAKQVARRMQVFLGSLEEKAHRAELVATEARELRRRQKLAMVLGVTIIAALITIGIALRSADQQRTTLWLERLTTAQDELDDAATKVAEYQDAGRHNAALTTARDALLVIEAKGLGVVAMTERAKRLISQTELRSWEFERRQEIERKNEALLSACDELRTRQTDTLVSYGAVNLAEALESDYEAAFRGYGIDLADDDLVPALEVLVASQIGAEVALALDDWAGLRRQIYGPLAFEVEAVTALALDLDPDPARTRLREALLSGVEQEILAFARLENLAELPPAALWSLSQGLSSFGLDEECFLVVRAGAVRHPEDFLLNFRSGQLYGERKAYFTALSSLSAARAVRPNSPAVHALLGEYLRLVGYLPRAVEVYAEALRLNPDYSEVRNSLAWLQIEMGDYASAARSYDLLLERFPEETIYEFKGLLARFSMGAATRAEVIDRLVSDETLRGRPQAAGVWALCYHPDPEQRDPALVISIQDSWGHEEPATEATEAAALLQLGRPTEALAALAHGELLLGGGATSVVGATSSKLRADYAVLRARAHLDLGDKERSSQLLQTAEEIMREFMYDGHEPWGGTSLMRLYRETTALLGE